MKAYTLTFILMLAYTTIFFTACKDEPNNATCSNIEQLKINQLQVIGSHNSYRLRTQDDIFNKLVELGQLISGFLDPKELDYSHEPLATQLGQYGMRALELDIYNDPNGGLFYNQRGNELVGIPVESGVPELLEPGFKILHIPDIDYRTHHYTLKSALQALKTWSDANPQHLPIFVQVETKTDGINDYLEYPGVAIPLPFTTGAADSLDAEIKSVFGESLDKVITPDRLRGTHSTLQAAVSAGAWQTIAQARGKFFFIIDGNYDFYIQSHPLFAGRVMFGFAPPRSPECAFIIANNSIEQIDSIKQWVSEGYMVRSRADAGTIEAREGDYSAMNAAFESGAHIISTDYYRPDPRAATDTAWTDFCVKFADGSTVRPNIINTDSTTWDCAVSR
jgi:hypothetical protein